MKPSLALAEHKDAIRQIVVRHRASNPRVFGSVVHGDDSEDSDLDLLVDPSPDSSLLDIACIQVEIEALTDFPNPGDSPVLREGLTPLKCLRFSLELRPRREGLRR